MPTEYLLPIGIDGTPFINEINKLRQTAVKLSDEVKKSNDAMSNSFSTAGKAASTITTETVKATSAVKEESKSISDNNAQLLATLDILTKVAAQQGKSFSADQLAKYSTAVKTIQGSLSDVLSKGAANIDPSKIAALDQQLQGITDDAEQFKVVIGFIQENLNDLQLNPEDALQLQNYIKLIQSAFSEFNGKPIDIPVKVDTASVTQAAEQVEQSLTITPKITFSEADINTVIEQIQQQVNSNEVDVNILSNAVTQGTEILQSLDQESTAYKTLSGSIDLANDKLNQFSQSSKTTALTVGQLVELIANKKVQLIDTSDVVEAAALNKEIAALEIDLEKIANAGKAGFDDLGNKIVSTESGAAKLTTRIREITNLLASGAIAKGSPQFQQLITEAAQLTDELGDTRNQIRLLSSDTSHLDAGIQAVQGIVGVFAAAQGAVALFGDENENLQKTLLKVNAAMSVLQGVQQVGQLLDRNSALNIFLIKTLRLDQAKATQAAAVSNVELATAEEGLEVAEEGATVAQEGLNVAMEANPAGILLLAVGALITAYTLFGNSAEKAEEDQKKVNEAIAAANEQMVVLARNYSSVYSSNTKSAENAVALAQAQGKSEAAIAVLKQKALQAKIQENKSLLANLGITEDSLKLNEAELLIRQEQLQSILDQVKFGRELTKDEQAKADALRSQISSLQAIINPAKEALNNIKDANNQIAVDAAATAQKGYEDSLKSATALAEAKVELAKKGSKDELNAQITAIRAEQRESLANVNLTAGERIKINVEADKKIQDAKRGFAVQELTDEISNQQAIVSASVEGTKEEYLAKKDILDKQAQIEILNAQGNAAKITEINAKLAKEKADLENQFDTSVRQDATNAEIASINQQLDAVEKGTDKELELKKKLIDNQALLESISTVSSIKNEVLRTEKIKEIYAKADADKLALDRDFFSAQLSQQQAYNKSIIDLTNAGLQAIVDDTSQSETKRFEARQQILKNELDNINNQIEDEKKLYDQGIINYQTYLTAINNLNTQAAGIQANITNNQKNFLPKFNLGDSIIKSLGFDPGDAAVKSFFGDLSKAVSNAYDEITRGIEEKAQRQIDAIQRVVDALDNQISDQQSIVDEQKKLSDDGLANDLANQQKKLDDLKAKKAAEVQAQQQAQDRLAKIQKEEAIVQQASVVASNVETGVNMIDAMSKIFKAHAGIPFAGVALAIGFGALMLSTFLAIKNAIKAATSDVPKFRKGGLKQLHVKGPSHEEGGVGLYDERTGKKLAEYEGGEDLFAVNKQSSKKHLPLLKAINDDNEPLIRKIIYERTGDNPNLNPLLIRIDYKPFEEMEVLRKVVKESPKPPMEEIAAVNRTSREVQTLIIQRQMGALNRNDLSQLDHLETIAVNTRKEEKAVVTDYGDYIIIKEKGRTRKIWKKKP